MSLHTKVGSVWKTVKAPFVKVSNSWRACKDVYIKSGGVWKSLYYKSSLCIDHFSIKLKLLLINQKLKKAKNVIVINTDEGLRKLVAS